MDTVSHSIELAFAEIRVADWPRAVRWYVELLGVRLVLEDVDHQYALLEAGANRFALKGVTRPGGASSNVRLVFEVGNVDSERDRLIGLGVEVGPASDHPAEAYRAVALVDSEGTPITLFSWLAPPAPGP